MMKHTPSASLDLELAKARQLLAAGRREEALALALTLLQQALGDLRHNLLTLQDNMARLQEGQDQSSTPPALDPGRCPVRPDGGYYH